VKDQKTVNAELIRKRQREEAQAARAKRKKEIEDAKAKRELRLMCTEILEMIKGRQFAQTDVVVDAEKMTLSTVLTLDTDISWDDRARACEALWAFQFKGEPHKEVVVECGGIEVLSELLDRPPKVAYQDQFALDAFSRHALVCLRSLATHENNVDHMVHAGVVRLMIKFVDAQDHDTKLIALETLASLGQHSKDTRKFLAGPQQRFLAKILGDKKAGQQNFHRIVKSGLEPSALAGLRLVEVLLTKDEHRLFVVNETFAISVIRTVMDSRNLQAQAMVCRMVMRLCQSDQCRVIMQKLGVSDFAAEFFVSAYDGESRAMACAALGSLVTSRDEALANKCLPRIWEILKERNKLISDEERALMELPGAMRALRAFCKQRWVADSVLTHEFLEPLIAHMADKEASHVTRAEAAHVLGSMALQTRHHETIMTALVPPYYPLMNLIYNGDQIEQFSAARAVQNLSYYSKYCERFANFKHVDAKFDKKSGKDTVTKWDALQAVTKLCLPTQATNCKTHGAGILRNFASCDSARERIIKHLNKGSPNSPGLLLVKLCSADNPLATRAHACAALGNLSSTVDNARTVCSIQAGRSVQMVANILFAEPQTPHDKLFAIESKLSAITTLSLLACDDECARHVLDSGALVKVASCLGSRLPSHLRLAAAKCLHNMTSFRSGSKAVVEGIGIVDGIVKTAKSDSQGLQEHMAATLANVSSFPNMIDHLMTSRCCSTIVYLLKKGQGTARRDASAICKNISRTRDAHYCMPLAEAGAVSILVKLLAVEKDVEDGCAELAALSLGRMGAADARIMSKVVDYKGFDGLLQLLGTGCETARVTAAKTLLYFADNKEFAKLMVQVGGIAQVSGGSKQASGGKMRA